MAFDPQAYAKSIGAKEIPDWLKTAAKQKASLSGQGTVKQIQNPHEFTLSTGLKTVPMTDTQAQYYVKGADVAPNKVLLNPVENLSRFNQEPVTYGGKHYKMQAEDRHFWDGFTGADDYAKRAQQAFKGNVYAPEGSNLQSQADTIYRANQFSNSSDKRYVPVEVNADGSPLNQSQHPVQPQAQRTASSIYQKNKPSTSPQLEASLNGLNKYLGDLLKPSNHPINIYGTNSVNNPYGTNSVNKSYVPTNQTSNNKQVKELERSPYPQSATFTRSTYQNSPVKQAPRVGNKPSTTPQNQAIMDGLSGFLRNLTKPVTSPITGPFTSPYGK